MPHSKRLVAEAVGTALLLATVVGSGIMGERLAGGNARFLEGTEKPGYTPELV